MYNKNIKPKRFVNYTNLTLFMSALAHDYKRYGLNGLKERYDNNKFRGMYKRYYKGYIEYLYNMENNIKIECTEYPEKLIVGIYIYDMYFKYKHKNILNESLAEAVPELLKQGFLITKVQEAVHGSSN